MALRDHRATAVSLRFTAGVLSRRTGRPVKSIRKRLRRYYFRFGQAKNWKSHSRHRDRALVAGSMRDARPARTPHINAGKQKDPDDVDEVPVPGGKLEAKMLRRREMSKIGTQQTHDQERRADDDMRAMKARRHEESGAVDVAAEIEPGMAIFVGLHAGECQSKYDRQD